MLARIRQGDTVFVISGKDKGKTGTVIKVFPEEGRVLIEGINLVTKHQKPTPRSEGKKFEREAPIHTCKVMPVDPSTGKPCRVRTAIVDGKKVRTSAKTGTPLANSK
jgi:large subunit ribosomal protein L24